MQKFLIQVVIQVGDRTRGSDGIRRKGLRVARKMRRLCGRSSWEVAAAGVHDRRYLHEERGLLLRGGEAEHDLGIERGSGTM